MTRMPRRKIPDAHLTKTAAQKCTQYCNSSCLEIYLQRAPCAVPFRRSGDVVEKITPEDELYFEVGVENFKGPALIVVSCVNKDKPYHAHRQFVLEGDNCQEGGFCLVNIMNGQEVEATISNIYIRQVDQVIPSSDTNITAVRLEFSVRIKDATVPGSWKSLESVRSQPIYDKKYFNVHHMGENFQNLLPRIEIIEQPVGTARYRYKSERSSAGSIPGKSSAANKTTFPAVRVILGSEEYEGLAKIEVSCITKDNPYRIHPHSLTSNKNRKNCRDGGIYSVEISEAQNMVATFENLGIMCIKRDDFEKALSARRKELIVNPFERNEANGGKREVGSVRLCFQAFLKSPGQENFNMILQPVISEPVDDMKRLMEPLNISILCPTKGSAKGRQQMIILCNKVVKEQIEIIFFEESIGWNKKVNKFNVHRQIALSFRTPPFEKISSRVKVSIKLKRNNEITNTDEYSDPVSFTYEPETGNTPPVTSNSDSAEPSVSSVHVQPKKQRIPSISGNHQGTIAPLPVSPESGMEIIDDNPQDDAIMGNRGIAVSSSKNIERSATMEDHSCNTDELLQEAFVELSKHPTKIESLENAYRILNLDNSSSLDRTVGDEAHKQIWNSNRLTYTQLQNVPSSPYLYLVNDEADKQSSNPNELPYPQLDQHNN